jgi:hypothetical protein
VRGPIYLHADLSIKVHMARPGARPSCGSTHLAVNAGRGLVALPRLIAGLRARWVIDREPNDADRLAGRPSRWGVFATLE